ncbi:hypothetical protein M427DRAFT_54388 [Gonapodya prolifera JEL478]|uniref:DNA mismatch repair protein MutL n=1 Tax=Gonapodya prolifera (strain JEL478) TaxID=1344416 RepID=A0A139AM15_GONPJ|nr:hypothetical protein M427DRAFT_54388 [Gonapodya prolifera JEL478]|eukprot:KXS17799.1 hypothetical protein M427DRAFT_54388 [Gonapodya prolifera JEL478]
MDNDEPDAVGQRGSGGSESACGCRHAGCGDQNQCFEDSQTSLERTSNASGGTSASTIRETHAPENPSTTPPAAPGRSIRPIDRSSLHRLTAAQVIVSLESAVKELVENALDAGATSIQVVFRDHGAVGFSVADNGHGIPKEDLPALGQKHHTSKIRSFSDLGQVSTYGFRGEALNSLCAIADVSIVTATKEPLGFELQLSSTSTLDAPPKPAARARGTTISVTNLFRSLPVRQQEFKRNARREYAKALATVQNYAVVSTGVRLSVVNIVNSRPTPMLTTKGNAHLRDNLADVFGAKAAIDVFDVDVSLKIPPPARGTAFTPISDALEQHQLSDSNDDTAGAYTIRVVGVMSHPRPSAGRSSSDTRQMYINGRPCESPKLAKAVAEEWRAAGGAGAGGGEGSGSGTGGLPQCFLDLKCPTDTYDVNVTPDKRTIFLHRENEIIEELRVALRLLLERQNTHYTTSQVLRGGMGGAMVRVVGGTVQSPANSASASDQRDDSEAPDVEEDVESLTGSEENEEEEGSPDEDMIVVDDDSEEDELEETGSADLPRRKLKRPSSPMEDDGDLDEQTDHTTTGETRSDSHVDPITGPTVVAPPGIPKIKAITSTLADFLARAGGQSSTPGPPIPSLSPVKKSSGKQRPRTSFTDSAPSATLPKRRRLDSSPIKKQEQANARWRTPVSMRTHTETSRMDFELKTLVARVKVYHQTRRTPRELKDTTASRTVATSEIGAEPPAAAEEILTRIVAKNDFDRMAVIGQFNLGFILVKLSKPVEFRSRNEKGKSELDLFIVDQHASDEKFNFENLKSTTPVRSQALILPQQLTLSAQDELAVADNLEVFTRNGFGVKVDLEAPPTQRCKLVSLPSVGGVDLNVKDFNDLLASVVEGGSGQPDLRCPRVNALFASRACRKSVMIGDPLSREAMEKIVRHMSGMIAPWNCPHGRPTMRHVLTIKN